MSIIEVTENLKNLFETEIFPNVIKNRFDLLSQSGSNAVGGGVRLFKALEPYDTVYIPVFIKNNIAEVGLYMRTLNSNVFNEFIEFLFETNKNIEALHFLYTPNKLDYIKPATHWHIDLPSTIEEFDKRISSKLRYNTKWYPKKINKEIGEYSVKKISKTEITPDIVNLYLKWKYNTYGFKYDAKKYLQDFGVTTAYVLRVESQILAIGFTCETNDKDVYFENFSFDVKYHKYSLGMVLYYHIIKDLIENKKQRFYLLGGNYDYKQKFNGIATETYTGYVYRNKNLVKHCYMLKNWINNLNVSKEKKKVLSRFFRIFIFNKCYQKIFDGY